MKPRGRRSISQAPENPRQAPLKANAISRQAPGSPDTTNNPKPKNKAGRPTDLPAFT